MLGVRDGAVVRLSWVEPGTIPPPSGAPGRVEAAVIARVRAQLDEYFAGERHVFDLPLAPAGGSLQQAVCAAMRAIPYGQTRTYGDLAAILGAPPQAIGQACGANPIPILIPCHRVVAAHGRLGGFSGGRGAETKLALLRLEGAILL